MTTRQPRRRPRSHDPERHCALDGSAPVALPPDHRVWRVSAGRVDVFLEHAKGRSFLASLEAEEHLFGPANLERGTIHVAGRAGSTLEAVDTAALDLEDLAAGANRWVAAVARPFGSAGSTTDGETVRLQAGSRTGPGSGSILRAAKDPVWVSIPAAGRVRLAGSDVVVEGPASLPVFGDLCLEVLDASTVWTDSSASLAADQVLVDKLATFNRYLPQLLEDLSERQSSATLSRLRTGLAETNRQIRSSLDTLARSSTASGAPPSLSSELAGQAGQALAHALDHLSIPYEPDRLAGSRAGLADVPALARRVGVRTRRVLLRPGWEKQDLGPLISVRGRTDSLVTLTRSPRGAYEVFDPQTRNVERVGVGNADTIGPTAYSLYRPMTKAPERLRNLLGFVWRDVRKDGVTALLSGAAIGLLGAVVPFITAVIVDNVIPSNEAPLLVQLGIALGVVALLSFAFTISHEVALHRMDGRTAAALQAALWDRLLRMPASFFRSYSAGDLAQRVAGIEAVRKAVVDVAMGASLSLVFSSFNVVLLFIFAPSVAVLAIAMIALLAVVTVCVGLLQIRYHRIIARIDGELSGLVFQYLQGVTKLRVAGAEGRAFARWANRYSLERSAQIKAGRIQNHYESFTGGFQILALAAIFVAMGVASPDELSAGTFVAFLTAFGVFQTAFIGFANALVSLFSVLPQYERSKPILATPTETDVVKVDPGQLKGKIEVSGLVFGYDEAGAPLFDGLDLAIEPGECVALVGGSGSGKSTLIRLLLGFERPAAGAILYDDQDLAHLDPSLLRRQIGVVLQTGRVFAGSILENIRGSDDLSFDDCMRAAEAAGLADDLRLMPMGLHTPLTEGATTLSGGQRQRILIARALAAGPKLLFLDEATSALDNRTQRVVTETLDRLGATRLIVAHRLSTVQNADRIYVLDQGRIVEHGTFEDLMAKQGHFAAQASRQLL